MDGKVALVTGASRGIGAEIARRWPAKAHPWVLGHFPDTEQTALAGAVVEQARQAGAKAVALPGDVTDGGGDARRPCAALVEAFGRLDVVVTNAGIIHRRPLVEVTEAEWDRVIAVNLKGTFNAIHAALPHLIRQRSGKIVTVASELALIGRAGAAAYAASKAGVIGLTKSLARELSPLGINVNAVAPGPTDTDMLRSSAEFRDENKANVPLRRWGHPRDIALTVLFLASDDSDVLRRPGPEPERRRGDVVGHEATSDPPRCHAGAGRAASSCPDAPAGGCPLHDRVSPMAQRPAAPAVRPPIRWPRGMTCAVCLTFDLDAETAWISRDPANEHRPAVMSQGAYGPKVGVPLILEFLRQNRLTRDVLRPGLDRRAVSRRCRGDPPPGPRGGPPRLPSRGARGTVPGRGRGDPA